MCAYMSALFLYSGQRYDAYDQAPSRFENAANKISLKCCECIQTRVELCDKCVQENWTFSGPILGFIAKDFPWDANMRSRHDETYGRPAGVDLWEYV